MKRFIKLLTVAMFCVAMFPAKPAQAGGNGQVLAGIAAGIIIGAIAADHRRDYRPSGYYVAPHYTVPTMQYRLPPPMCMCRDYLGRPVLRPCQPRPYAYGGICHQTPYGTYCH